MALKGIEGTVGGCGTVSRSRSRSRARIRGRCITARAKTPPAVMWRLRESAAGAGHAGHSMTVGIPVLRGWVG